MRSTIALLPVLTALTLGIAGCDKPKEPGEQANAAVAGESTAAPANKAAAGGDVERIGTIDRSHKGEAAPALAFQAPDGKPATLAAFKGKPLLLNLWATWCAPCVREMPALDRLAQREGDRIRVLTVSQDLEGAAKVTPYFAKAGFKALQPYLDPDVGLSTHYGVNLPTTVFYDAQGREVWRVAGDMDWDGDTAKAWLAEAG
ncbi:TlpA family protein disulfide reductase [Sphingomonas sp. BT-65]|uniref:TlpA family protein disulfide reductase n=1 Tax=Sphingomonas sp. BT-65 TaxID=2989821 RepID=UPI0022363C37|nr:TlpA disulfide reductase family protein [Sphingomonas sp. BT-65]MCW4462527.1 TlpA family protein disulfide reductase [Sphingomonas sp. BT-65]